MKPLLKYSNLHAFSLSQICVQISPKMLVNEINSYFSRKITLTMVILTLDKFLRLKKNRLILLKMTQTLNSWIFYLISCASSFPNCKSRYFRYLASIIVIVTALSVWHPSTIFDTPASLELLSMKKPGCLGWGSGTPSLPSMETTDDIAGLSCGSFWTHNRPTWMHLRNWGLTYDSFKHGSSNSKALFSFHSSQA